MMSVDILPTSLPLDASKHFSSVLLPYVESLIKSLGTSVTRTGVAESDEYTQALDRATIADKGKLVGKHGWLQQAIDKFHLDDVFDPAPLAKKKAGNQQPPVLKMKKLLMLGSGMVAGPAVDEIAKRRDVQLVIGEPSHMDFWVIVMMEFLWGSVASDSLRELEMLTQEHPTVQYRVIDVADRDEVSRLVEGSEVVIRCVSFTQCLSALLTPSTAFSQLRSTRISHNCVSSFGNISSPLHTLALICKA
jgi:alpha-aminoadipic semialdehyde synthase